MPYVITTTADDPHVGVPMGERVTVARRAVATLDDARDAVASYVGDYDAGSFNAHCRADDIESQVAAVAGSGGTIGPLPDGTVIEVQRVCWGWIIGCAEDLGIDTDAVYADHGDIGIMDAYNAGQR